MPDDVSETFARRLRAERERSGVSQAELAERVAAALGTPFYPTAVTKVEKRDREVKLSEAVALADALGLPLLALMIEPDAVHVELDRAREDLLATEAAITSSQRNVEQWSVDAAALRRRIAELEAFRSGRAGPGGPVAG